MDDTTALLDRPCLTGFTLPLGTIRIRSSMSGKPGGGRKRIVQVRVIKMRNDGPIGQRWIHFAHWWWEQHRGPVPAGKRIFHLDGDTLNDDPENLALGNAADSFAIWHENNPAGSRRNYRKCREATIESNRLRGEINRGTSLLPSQWYAVDLDRRIIYQGPARKRWQIWARFGVPAELARSRWAIGHALGWPGRSRTAACILSALAGAQWLGFAQLATLTRQFAAARHWRSIDVFQSLHQYVTEVRDCVVVRRRGREGSLYHIAPSALAARAESCPVVPIRGMELTASSYATFDRRGFAQRQDQST